MDTHKLMRKRDKKKKDKKHKKERKERDLAEASDEEPEKLVQEEAPKRRQSVDSDRPSRK